MALTPLQAQKLLTSNFSFSQLGFSMLVTRLKGSYSSDASPTTLNKCADELNTFLQKYSGVMAKDMVIISNL